MSDYLKKIVVLVIALPLVALLLMYQINPKLLQPSSDSFILSFLPMFGNVEASALRPNQSKTPSQLLNLLWRTFAISDSLFTGKRGGVRDPMQPLVKTGYTVQASLRREATKIAPPKFPFTRRDIGAIIWNETNPIVFIRGRRHNVGDVVNEATIRSITKTSVTFVWRDQIHVIERAAPSLNIE